MFNPLIYYNHLFLSSFFSLPEFYFYLLVCVFANDIACEYHCYSLWTMVPSCHCLIYVLEEKFIEEHITVSVNQINTNTHIVILTQ